MSRRRVVVTGLGCVSPVGNTVADAWANLLAGQSGIDLITKFDTSNFACKIAGEVKGFDLESYISAKDARAMDSFIHYGIAAAVQAVQDAGLPTGEALSEDLATRIGCVIGSGIGGLPLIENTHAEFVNRGARRITPFFVPASIINMVAGHVSMRFGFKGPNLAVVTACTTGLHSIGEAGRHIEYGDADVMIAGGSECCMSPLGVGGFAAMRALSTRNDDPATASRPWDKDRDGFVLGEGAGVIGRQSHGANMRPTFGVVNRSTLTCKQAACCRTGRYRPSSARTGGVPSGPGHQEPMAAGRCPIPVTPVGQGTMPWKTACWQ